MGRQRRLHEEFDRTSDPDKLLLCRRTRLPPLRRLPRLDRGWCQVLARRASKLLARGRRMRFGDCGTRGLTLLAYKYKISNSYIMKVDIFS
jgi:hypothetical protein